MAIGDPSAPEGHEAGRSGGTNPRDTGSEDDLRGLRRGRRKKRDPLTREEEPASLNELLAQGNVGNVSGLGGFRDVIAGDILRRRAARGAQRIKFSETLAETTRRSLFGL